MLWKNGAPHSWMRLVERSNTEVSDISELPQSRSKLSFLGSPTAVFLFENQSRSSKICVDRDRSKY